MLSFLGLLQKKYLGVGEGGGEGKQYIFLWVVGVAIFQIIWVIGDYMGGGILSENLFLTFDRYIKSNVPVSIKISNHNLPVYLLYEIIQSTHK